MCAAVTYVNNESTIETQGTIWELHQCVFLTYFTYMSLINALKNCNRAFKKHIKNVTAELTVPI